MPGLSGSNLPTVCGVGVVTNTRSALKRAMQHPYRYAATASWWMERFLIPPTFKVAAMPGPAKESCRVREIIIPPSPPKKLCKSKHTITIARLKLNCIKWQRSRYLQECVKLGYNLPKN
jgi:hypothetical protein